MDSILCVIAGYCIWRGFNGYGRINFLTAMLFCGAALLLWR